MKFKEKQKPAKNCLVKSKMNIKNVKTSETKKMHNKTFKCSKLLLF